VLFIHYFAINLFAASSQLSQVLYNSVHFAENGNDLVVEIDKIHRALADGANPNWIDTKDKRHDSILGKYVRLISLSRDQSLQKKASRQSICCLNMALNFSTVTGQYHIFRSVGVNTKL
jgi:hypothetical protein